MGWRYALGHVQGEIALELARVAFKRMILNE